MIFHGGLGVQLGQYNNSLTRIESDHQERLDQQLDLFDSYPTSPNQFHGSLGSNKVVEGSTQARRIGYSTASSIPVHNTAFSGASIATMPQKRNASGEPNGSIAPVAKQIKSEQHPEEFSNTVKKKLQASTRTGQACDRCKVGLTLQKHETDGNVMRFPDC